MTCGMSRLATVVTAVFAIAIVGLVMALEKWTRV